MDAHRERLLEKLLRISSLRKQVSSSENPSIRDAYAHASYLYEQEEVEEACKILERLTLETPTARAPWLALGMAQFRLGRLAEAQASLSASWVLEPLDPTPVYTLGLMKRRQGRDDEARKLFTQVLRLASHSPHFFDIEIKAASHLEELNNS
jgi:Flp pilus assembly protein TadD